jgi:hypothetical protein
VKLERNTRARNLAYFIVRDLKIGVSDYAKMGRSLRYCLNVIAKHTNATWAVEKSNDRYLLVNFSEKY